MSGEGNSTPQTEGGCDWPHELYTTPTKLFVRLDEDLTSRTALGVEQRHDGVEQALHGPFYSYLPNLPQFASAIKILCK